MGIWSLFLALFSYLSTSDRSSFLKSTKILLYEPAQWWSDSGGCNPSASRAGSFIQDEQSALRVSSHY
jgi:hypothetical protein